ncbi:hypothetical protein AB0Q54_05790 [Enterococcus faecalis]|uniref:hypothetical protein n=1 Tax=Enterococcus faecalis TaxID=1351 RepID=UPI0015738539|nr:hypothetical protein [Enterococcus faecalis]
MPKEAKLNEGVLYHHDFSKFQHSIQLAKEKCPVPTEFVLTEVQDEIQQNKQPVIRLRFTRSVEANQLYGEHFSVVIRKSDDSILGFVDLRLETVVLDSNELPSMETTRNLAKRVFESFNPDYYTRLKNLWID